MVFCFSFVLLYLSFQTTRLLIFGKTTTATVTWAEERLTGYDEDGEAQYSHYLHYKFEAKKANYTGTSGVSESTLKHHPKDSEVTITYLRWNPTQNRYGGRLTLLWQLILSLLGVIVCVWAAVTVFINVVFQGVQNAEYPGARKLRRRRR